MTTIFNTLIDPDNQPLTSRQVRLQLVSPGFITGAQAEILRTAYAITDNTGRYEFDDVEPNAAVDPSGTYYLLWESSLEQPWTIVVPASGTPLWVHDLLVDNPPSPAPVTAGVVAVVAGTGVTVDSTDPQRPVVSATGGGGGTVLQYTLTAVSNWTQAHSFAYDPAVRLVDAAGHAVDSDVSYPDPTHVNVVFAAPFTGIVLLS